ncbi:hypothetical protein FZI91_03415 [Mycobacterium sp. CBMA271]|uniref:WXG100 family type VII secretion target n=1 Tax=unclassified Mycobacteroides TaxID=2618759 RepID=UPI0012DEDB28|nr:MULTISPECIES: WXG100 family type VII secretion target [unclassified Mycobacteroides]MUM18169.1 hypothetical protein [Mycobacteroides sp. CBMA 326]MUM20755.1 hypothetical protein [Mycobacteroides sp. CBMA 271]
MAYKQDIDLITAAEQHIDSRHGEFNGLDNRLINEVDSIPKSTWDGSAAQAAQEAASRIHGLMAKTTQTLGEIREVMQVNRQHLEELENNGGQGFQHIG